MGVHVQLFNDALNTSSFTMTTLGTAVFGIELSKGTFHRAVPRFFLSPQVTISLLDASYRLTRCRWIYNELIQVKTLLSTHTIVWHVSAQQSTSISWCRESTVLTSLSGCQFFHRSWCFWDCSRICSLTEPNPMRTIMNHLVSCSKQF